MAVPGVVGIEVAGRQSTYVMRLVLGNITFDNAITAASAQDFLSSVASSRRQIEQVLSSY